VLKATARPADRGSVERSLIGFCAFLGGGVGSYVPALWGGSMLGAASLGLGVVGGIAGIWLGFRLAQLV
jgi:hypothetical protein